MTPTLALTLGPDLEPKPFPNSTCDVAHRIHGSATLASSCGLRPLQCHACAHGAAQRGQASVYSPVWLGTAHVSRV